MNKFEYSVPTEKTVLNETSNFVEKLIVNDSIFFKAIFFFVYLLALGGIIAIFFTIVTGFDAVYKQSRFKIFGVSLFFGLSILALVSFVFHGFHKSWVEPKKLSDYEKLKKFLALRNVIPIILNLRLAKLKNAYLVKSDLRDVDLTGADLSCADLRVSNLDKAKLMNADLSAVDLREASLRETNLENANLSLAFLARTSMISANLKNANLSEATLSDADLTNANLSNANLKKANLNGANLTGANLVGADFSNANLNNVIGL